MSTRVRVGVDVRKGNVDKAISIFKKKVRESGVLQQYRENQEFKKPSTIKREKRKEKVYKLRKS